MRSFLLCALLALAPAALAQPIDVDELDALFEAEPRVEVNLRGALLRLASAAAGEEDPAAAAMLDGLRGVTVRIYASPPDVRGLAVERFATLGRRLERDGWLTLVRVRSLPAAAREDGDEDGDVWIYVRDDGDVFDGMAVLAVDHDDENAVFVFIDGTIDPTQVAALSRRFAHVDVDVDEDIDVDVDVEVDDDDN